MSDQSKSTRAKLFSDSLTKRLGEDLPAGERASIARIVQALLDETPDSHAPRSHDVTVLMADLRGFSTLAATTTPAVLVRSLQSFFECMTEVIHAHGGFVDKFLGDGVMALFGAPAPCSDHLHRALSCAAQMQTAMLALNERNAAGQLPALHAGIGLNCGEVMAGSFGSEHYREYTVIGEEVNLASRIENFALRGEVLLSEACYRAAKDSIDVADVRNLRIKGRNGEVTLYQLGAVKGANPIVVPRIEVRESPRIAVDLPLRYRAVRDKRMLPPDREGNILNLGYGGMLAHLPIPLPERGEIAFSVAPEPMATDHDDIYARAVQQRTTTTGVEAAMAFTSISSRGRDAVKRYVDQTLWGA